VKRLRFFPDDIADPVWEPDRPGFNVNLDHLPLHDDTRAALRAWCRQWALLVDRAIWAEAFKDGMSSQSKRPDHTTGTRSNDC